MWALVLARCNVLLANDIVKYPANIADLADLAAASGQELRRNQALADDKNGDLLLFLWVRAQCTKLLRHSGQIGADLAHRVGQRSPGLPPGLVKVPNRRRSLTIWQVRCEPKLTRL
jgi:hypothetical protein